MDIIPTSSNKDYTEPEYGYNSILLSTINNKNWYWCETPSQLLQPKG